MHLYEGIFWKSVHKEGKEKNHALNDRKIG